MTPFHIAICTSTILAGLALVLFAIFLFISKQYSLFLLGALLALLGHIALVAGWALNSKWENKAGVEA